MPLNEGNAWADDWLDRVEDGTLTMSQRKLSTIEAHGGIEFARDAALRRGLHLVRLMDDMGTELVAASRHPFEVIC